MHGMRAAVLIGKPGTVARGRPKGGDDFGTPVKITTDGRTGAAAGGSKDPITVAVAEGAVRSATPQARQSFRPI